MRVHIHLSGPWDKSTSKVITYHNYSHKNHIAFKTLKSELASDTEEK